MIRIGQRLERAYSTVRLLCPGSLTRASGVAAKCIRRKREESGYEKEAEPIEDRSAEIRQGSVKVGHPRGSCKGCFARR